jgi:hypothetical protein
MSARCFGIFLLLLFAGEVGVAVAAEWQPGVSHDLTFRDVDGNDLSTNDGHVTVITVVTRADEANARAVADLVPDQYVGDANYRYVTLVNFQGRLARPFHGLTRAIIRTRLASEARELKPQYLAKKIARDPRDDLHVIADFDGSAVARLGLPANDAGVAVFVFDGKGKLVARWNGVPPDDSLAKALASAE